jgi:diguanylate cyclase (GGDEF)-like protein
MSDWRRSALAVALWLMATGHLLAQIETAPQLVTLRPLRASGIMALVPAALLFVLSRYWRREYVLAWVAAWLCLATPLFVFSTGIDFLNLEPSTRAAESFDWRHAVTAIAAVIWLGGMVLLALSASWVRGPVRWPRRIWELAAAGMIAVAAGSLFVGFNATLRAVWLGGLLCFVVGAYGFLQIARRDQFFGALLMGAALTTLPLHAALSELLSFLRISVPDPVEIWILVYAVLALGMHLLVFEDVTYELRKQNAALREAQAALTAKAITDPLTGCYNRRFFDEIAPRELQRLQRHAFPLALLFFDCDRFKSVNDGYGHETGDRVLQLIAQLLRSAARQSEYVFRWGGDEFLVMLTCDEASAAAKAQDVQRAFLEHPLIKGLETGVRLSVGRVIVPATATDLLGYVEEVDRRMYAAKRQLLTTES